MPQTHPIQLTVTPTIDTAAYADGDNVGGLITLANAAFDANGSAELRRVRITDKSFQQASLELWCFNANPTASTLTNNAAMVVHVNDLAKVTCVIPVTSYNISAAAATAIGINSQFSEILYADPAKQMYFALKLNGSTPTYAELALSLYLDLVLD